MQDQISQLGQKDVAAIEVAVEGRWQTVIIYLFLPKGVAFSYVRMKKLHLEHLQESHAPSFTKKYTYTIFNLIRCDGHSNATAVFKGSNIDW